MENNFEVAAKWIDESDGILITAGAGMGVDSGLPDFRGNQGFWNQYPALDRQGLSFIDIADPEMFIRDPRTAWGFYGHRLKLYRNTLPHFGFQILKRWVAGKVHGAFVFTSNVDGHFQRAGFKESAIYECHGSIHAMQCCGNCDETWGAYSFHPEIDSGQCRLISEVPRCRQCGQVARPNILMFGDPYWRAAIYDEQHQSYLEWLNQVSSLVVIELGAGTAIPTARWESERRAGRKLIRINAREAQIDSGQGISFTAGALSTLKELNIHIGTRCDKQLSEETTNIIAQIIADHFSERAAQDYVSLATTNGIIGVRCCDDIWWQTLRCIGIDLGPPPENNADHLNKYWTEERGKYSHIGYEDIRQDFGNLIDTINRFIDDHSAFMNHSKLREKLKLKGIVTNGDVFRICSISLIDSVFENNQVDISKVRYLTDNWIYLSLLENQKFREKIELITKSYF